MQQSSRFEAIALIGSEKVKALEDAGLTIISQQKLTSQQEKEKLIERRNKELRELLTQAIVDKEALIRHLKTVILKLAEEERCESSVISQ